jgi:hypothetical protein
MAFNNNQPNIKTTKQWNFLKFPLSTSQLEMLSVWEKRFFCVVATFRLSIWRFNVTAVVTELMSWKQEHELYLPWLFDSSAVYLDREYIPALFHKIVLYWCKLFDHLHDVVMNLLVILNDIWILHSKICEKKEITSI